jgi:hypothetical protein
MPQRRFGRFWPIDGMPNVIICLKQENIAYIFWDIKTIEAFFRDRTVRLIDRLFSVIPVIFFRLIDID